MIGCDGSTGMTFAAAESRRGRPARSIPVACERATCVRELDRQRGGRPHASANEAHQASSTHPPGMRMSPVDIGARPAASTIETGGTNTRGHAATPQDHVDEAAADAAVAVDERVDRLELRVRDRRLGDGRQVVPVHEGEEIGDQRRDLVLAAAARSRRRRVRQAAADPVLLAAEGPGMTRAGSGAMRVRGWRGHRPSCARACAVPDGDRLLHRDDVGSDSPRGPLGRSRVDERAREVPLARARCPRSGSTRSPPSAGAARRRPRAREPARRVELPDQRSRRRR